jgi:RHS repeat-associated protein
MRAKKRINSVAWQRTCSLCARLVACLLVASQAIYPAVAEDVPGAPQRINTSSPDAAAPEGVQATLADPSNSAGPGFSQVAPIPAPNASRGIDLPRGFSGSKLSNKSYRTHLLDSNYLALNGQPPSFPGQEDESASAKTGVIFSPAEASFGDVGAGITSHAITVTAHNYLSSAAKYISSSGLTEFKFTKETCPLPGNGKILAPGASCTFEVVFAPTAAAAANGAIVVGVGSQRYTFQLHGTGVVAKVDFSPAEANFGDAGAKTTTGSIKVTANNYSSSAVKYLSSSGLKEFKIEGGTCPLPGNGKTLQPGGACTFEVAFAPTADGAASGEISFSDGTKKATFQLTGTGVAQKVAFSPAEASFGDVAVGVTSHPITVGIHNYTGSPVRYLSSTNLKDFKFTGATCPLPGNGKTLEPDASCTLTVDFTPTAAGAVSGDIKFSDGKSSDTFELSGTGTSVAPHASAGGPYTGTAGQTVTFNGSASKAPAGEKLTAYAWTFGDGATATGVGPTHSYAKSGAYAVKVTVTDTSGGTNSASTTATIGAPAAPSISGFSPTSGPVGTVIKVTGANLSAPGVSAPQVSLAQQGSGLLSAPISGYSASSLSFVIPPGATTGPIEITVGTHTATSSGTLTVTTSSNYTLGVSPSTVQLIQGQSTAIAVSLNSSNGFSGLATLSVTGVPSGVTASFSPTTITAGQVSTLTLTAPSSQTTGTSTITVAAAATINGQAANQSGTASVQVTAITTSFLGRTVVDDAAQEPIAGVSVSFLGQDGAGRTTGCSGSTVSDAGGNFSLTNLPTACTGPQLISYNGSTATSPAGKYAGVNLTYTMTANQVTASPVLVHLPRIDNAETVEVQQNAANDQVFYYSSIPGVKVTVYAGTTLSLDDGSQPNPFPLVALSIPLDRLPDKIPTTGMLMPFIVAFQPANAVASQPVAVNFPNSLGIGPNTSVMFVTLDPTRGTMVPYGTGTVSADGTEFVANADPNHPGHLYGLVHFDWHGPVAGPPPENNPSPDGCGGSGAGSGGSGGGSGGGPSPPSCDVAGPVDVSSGIVSYTAADLQVKGGRGSIGIYRYYRTLDSNAGPFGLGTSMSYSYSLNTLSYIDGGATITLATPDGNQYTMSQAPDGTFVNAAIPSLRGAVLTTNGTAGPYALRLVGGTVYTFTVNTALGFRGAFLTSITDLNGNITTFTLNPTNPQQVLAITDPVGRTLTFTYDGSNRVIKATDPIGRSVQYAYNAQGTLSTFTDANGGVTSYTYDSANNLATITDPRGIVIEQDTYNESFDGRITQQVRADGGIFKFAYTLLNPNLATSPVLQTVVTDPLGNQTTYRFNPQGFLVSAMDASGQTRTLTRDPTHNNLVTSYTGLGSCPVCGNPAAGGVSYTFDSLGNELTSTDGDGNTTIFTYDPRFNKITSIKDPLGNVTQFTYNSTGNLTSSLDPNGHLTKYSYNSFGQITQLTDPTGAAVTFSYDAFGNLSSSTNALGNTSSFIYDAVSRLTQSVDPLGRPSSTSYDALNHIVSVTDQSNNVTQLTYDPVGSVLTMKDPKGNVTTFTYDSMSRVSTRANPLGKSQSYAYDLDSNLAKFTDRRGQASSFQYDMMNRPVQATYPDSTVAMTYDAAGRLLTVNDSASGTFGFGYDSAGRLLTQNEPNGTVQYARDAVGRTATLQVAGLSPVSYKYDSAGNMTGASNAAAGVTYAYDPRNLPATLSRTNGVTSTFTFDPVGELLSVIHAKGASALNTQNYVYAADGTRSTVSNNISQSLVTQSSTSTVDTANELLTNGGTTYTSDANGNRLSETNGSTQVNYTWDSRNRLTSIADNSGNKTVLHYDFGRNLIEVDRTTPKATTAQKFVFDSLTNVVSLTDSSGLPVSVLTGQAVDSHFASIDSSGTVLFGLGDAVGSNVTVTDATGTLASPLYFEPFGQITGTPAANFPFAFTGRVSLTGNLQYFRNRIYDAGTGRFLSEDPLGYEGSGSSLYEYAGDNPITNEDPLGLKYWSRSLGTFLDRVAGKKLLDAVGDDIADEIEDAPIDAALEGLENAANCATGSSLPGNLVKTGYQSSKVVQDVGSTVEAAEIFSLAIATGPIGWVLGGAYLAYQGYSLVSDSIELGQDIGETIANEAPKCGCGTQ